MKFKSSGFQRGNRRNSPWKIFEVPSPPPPSRGFDSKLKSKLNQEKMGNYRLKTVRKLEGIRKRVKIAILENFTHPLPLEVSEYGHH